MTPIRNIWRRWVSVQDDDGTGDVGMKKKHVVSAVLLAALLTGCGGDTVPEEQNIIDTVLADVPYGESATPTPEDSTFRRPENLPSARVDLAGYECAADKRAVFSAAELPETFYVLDAWSREPVYEGKLRKKGEEGDRILYQADFSSVGTPGEYVLYNESCGYSDPFLIRDGIYTDRIGNYLDRLKECRCGDSCHTSTAEGRDVSGGWHTEGNYRRDVCNGAGIMLNLLLAYEYEPEAFAEGSVLPYRPNGIPDVLEETAREAQWLHKMREPDGSVHAAVAAVGITDHEDASADLSEQVLEPVNRDATILFTAAMARFSAVWKAYDAEMAAQCLKDAEDAYAWLKKDGSTEDGAWYMLNTILFRTTGEDIYHKDILTLLSRPGTRLEGQKVGCVDPVFMGDHNYLSTKRIADQDSCEKIMDDIMKRARRISEASYADPWLVGEDGKTEDIPALLADAGLLTWVNGVITNREYRRVIQEHVHCLCGRNRRNENYVTDHGVRTEAGEGSDGDFSESTELYYGSELVVILSRIDIRYEQVY